jgi:ABC-type sugar transport system permease subunit
VSFKLGYSSALSVVLTLVILILAALQITLTVRSEAA